jgi:hypothetical protein
MWPLGDFEMNDWTKTAEKMPEKDGNYFVYHKGQVRILTWNSHYRNWDDGEGDDYFCDAEDGTHWIEFIWPDRPSDI